MDSLRHPGNNWCVYRRPNGHHITLTKLLYCQNQTFPFSAVCASALKVVANEIQGRWQVLGSNPDISQKYKMGDTSKGVVNTL